MQKWEYRVVDYKASSGAFVYNVEARDLEMVLNSYGRDGWELARIVENLHWTRKMTIILKRPTKN